MSIQEFLRAIDHITKYLSNTYPGDPEIKKWNELYCKNYHQLIQQHIKLQEDNERLEQNILALQLQLTTLQEENNEPKQNTSNTTKKAHRYQEIKTKIEKSFSEDRRITGEITPGELPTVDKCVETLTNIDKLISSDKRNIIFNSCNKGYALKKLKVLAKERRKGLMETLKNYDFNYPLSHCNFLIRFYVFTMEHNILKCALSVEYIRRNFTIIQQVFNDKGW
ncbi:uncharacterized protein LOC128547478 [Mercenaria mercenaria]|uniref:uncharacterized protein LOC128547478 n=1 Tax=Mercenaria mercenaria TaxID=6596 RepID=UPI00234E3AEA|nr:uncharacterized protein LOC128547478 [Mercenaria mercenaria]